jgi:hypothetical protein
MCVLNLTQHLATPEQAVSGVINLPTWARQEAVDLLTFDDIPDARRVRWAASLLAQLCQDVASTMAVDAVMIGGAPFLMPPLEAALKAVGLQPVHAFSRRESVEQTQPDGSVRKVGVFRHVGFVRG